MAFARVLFALTILVLGLCTVADANGWDRDDHQGEQRENRGNANLKAIGASNVKFSLDMYKVLSRTPGNVFFSPLSIHSILTMLSIGAKENTYSQIKQGLHLPSVNESNVGYRALNKAFRSTIDKGVTIKVANKVYSTKRVPLSDSFKQASKDYFNSEAESVDFGNSETVRNQINRWVDENTNHKIVDLVPAGVLNSETAMVLVNAVFFKGKWHTEFDPANTTEGDFNGDQGTEKVNFMRTTSDFGYKYSHKMKSSAVELGYNGGKFSMVILLPSKATGFKQMEDLVSTTRTVDYLPGQYDRFNVNLWLPKFRLEQTTPLAGPLGELGMTDMFGNNADLRGLADGGSGLKVSKVLHKAFVEVNEEGSEAAATTVLAAQTLSLHSEDSDTVDFILNRPFIFMIRHKPSNSILFMGRYASPSGTTGASAAQPSSTPRPRFSARPNTRKPTRNEGAFSEPPRRSNPNQESSASQSSSRQPAPAEQFDVKMGPSPTRSPSKGWSYPSSDQPYGYGD